MKVPLLPEGHSRPIGRYSPGIAWTVSPGDRLVFVTGQVAVDAEGRTLALGDPAGQTEIVFHNIERVLAEAGGGLEDLVSLTVYLTDRDDFQHVSRVRNAVLPDVAPSSTLVVVASLADPDHVVEISGVAIVPAR